jgi:hypothetical protein
MALQEFVPKVALVASKSFLICHSERNEESLACKQEIPRFSRNDKLRRSEQIPEEP